MSTEPNTQRAIVLTIDDCAKQFELYAQSNDGRNIERAHAYRHCSEFLTEFCKQPETGAVDVWGDKHDEWSDAIIQAHPLTTGKDAPYAVALKMVGNRHAKYALVDLVNWLLVRAEAAEARVKEVEVKLEGALKLTTANSIEHVSKLER